MTREEKELLFIDLCGRLAYQPICHITNENGVSIDDILTTSTINHLDIWEVKSYLRPLSSMTEEEHNEWFNYHHEIELKEVKSSGDYLKAAILGEAASIDWLNAHHFDYRGLIEKGLALEMKEVDLEKENENPKITTGTKIRSKANPDVILSIISDDCHGDEFECSNGSVLSLRQIEKYYDIYIEEK